MRAREPPVRVDGRARRQLGHERTGRVARHAVEGELDAQRADLLVELNACSRVSFARGSGAGVCASLRQSRPRCARVLCKRLVLCAPYESLLELSTCVAPSLEVQGNKSAGKQEVLRATCRRAEPLQHLDVLTPVGDVHYLWDCNHSRVQLQHGQWDCSSIGECCIEKHNTMQCTHAHLEDVAPRRQSRAPPCKASGRGRRRRRCV